MNGNETWTVGEEGVKFFGCFAKREKEIMSQRQEERERKQVERERRKRLA